VSVEDGVEETESESVSLSLLRFFRWLMTISVECRRADRLAFSFLGEAMPLRVRMPDIEETLCE